MVLSIEFASHRGFLRWQWWHNYLAERVHVKINALNKITLSGYVRMPHDNAAYAYGEWHQREIQQAWRWQRHQHGFY